MGCLDPRNRSSCPKRSLTARLSLQRERGREAGALCEAKLFLTSSSSHATSNTGFASGDIGKRAFHPALVRQTGQQLTGVHADQRPPKVKRSSANLSRRLHCGVGSREGSVQLQAGLPASRVTFSGGD